MQQNLAVFNRACYQLLRASENLTDLSFIQRGRLPLSLEKTDLVDFLEELSQHADDLCWQAGRTLEVDLPQAPIFVWIDRRQVRRGAAVQRNQIYRAGRRFASVAYTARQTFHDPAV